MPCKVWDEITYPFLNFQRLHRWSLGMDTGLDTYFFLDLAVGQPSTNIDLSEIEIYLAW